MSQFDTKYLGLCREILEEGEIVSVNKYIKINPSTQNTMPNHFAQTQAGTIVYRAKEPKVLYFDLQEEFPILTTKFVGWKTAILEMLWIYQVQSNDVRWLQSRNIHIWDEWEISENGTYMDKDFRNLYREKGLTENPAHTIGTAYGWIVNKYQLTQSLISTLPHNRRMVMSLWQNEWLPTAALPSCVWNTQWSVSENKYLNLVVTVRSNDVPLGMPFNVCQYAVLCYLIAKETGLKPGSMAYVINDAHIYANQVEGIKEQQKRAENQLIQNGDLPQSPKIWINPEKKFFELDNSTALEDIKLIDYEHLGRIKMPVTA